MASHAHSKKRKRNAVVLHQASNAGSDGADTSRPTAVYTPTRGRSHTLSIALPGSIIGNAQSHELKTAMAGAIARAAAVFSVDEIIIFNDGQSQKHNKDRRSGGGYHNDNRSHSYNDDQSSYTGYSDPDNFLYHLLSYLETPPNLRRTLFPLHPNLRTAGTLPSLDMPHHLRADEWCQYREGVVVDPAEDSWNDDGAAQGYVQDHSTPSSAKKRKKKISIDDAPDATAGGSPPTFVDAGLPRPIRLSLPLPAPPQTRVTLKFSAIDDPGEYDDLQAEAVDPAVPREEAGYYWGYTTRQASSLGAVFTECPWDGGYDISIGTSERGVPLSNLLSPSGKGKPAKADEGAQALPPSFQHLVLVFGGVAGLEVAANADKELAEKGISGKNVGDIFDAWVNLVPGQGSRTIRCEEAVWLGLMGLREYVGRNGER